MMGNRGSQTSQAAIPLLDSGAPLSSLIEVAGDNVVVTLRAGGRVADRNAGTEHGPGSAEAMVSSKSAAVFPQQVTQQP